MCLALNKLSAQKNVAAMRQFLALKHLVSAERMFSAENIFRAKFCFSAKRCGPKALQICHTWPTGLHDLKKIDCLTIIPFSAEKLFIAEKNV